MELLCIPRTSFLQPAKPTQAEKMWLPCLLSCLVCCKDYACLNAKAKATFSRLLILLGYITVNSPLCVRLLSLVVSLVVAPVALMLVRLLIHVLALTRRSSPVNSVIWRLRSGSRDL